jgi:hypothetical protein
MGTRELGCLVPGLRFDGSGLTLKHMLKVKTAASRVTQAAALRWGMWWSSESMARPWEYMILRLLVESSSLSE